MSENGIEISKLNDFIFCPVSIYFHNLDEEENKLENQEISQIAGTNAHQSIDNQYYSTLKSVLQGTGVYSERYNLIGKIDVFDKESGVLTERKKHVSKIYDGFIFQLYAQYFGLKEVGFDVKKLRIHSLDDNKTYDINLPEDDLEMFVKFKKLIFDIENFDFVDFKQENIEKCKNCIYRHLCAYTLYEEALI